MRFLSSTFLLPSDPRPIDSKNVLDKISFLPRDRNNCLTKLGFPFPNRNIPVQSPHSRTAEEEAQGQEEEEEEEEEEAEDQEGEEESEKEAAEAQEQECPTSVHYTLL